MAIKPISVLQSEFRQALADSRFPPAVQRRSATSLATRVEVFRSEHRDSAGRMHREAGRRIRRVIRGMTLAVGHADGHHDASVRREAKALIRAVQHLSFEELESRLSKFNGRLNAAGHSLKERRKLESRARYIVGTADDDLAVVELTSSDQLQSTGRQLENCVAHKRGSGRGYHEALRDAQADNGGSRFYRLETASTGDANGLMEVDADTDCVLEVSDDFELPSQAAGLGILRTLGITADDMDPFSQRGALSVFLTGTPPTRWIQVGSDEYRCWVFPESRRLVLKRKRGTWSMFKWSLPRPPRRRGTRRTPRQAYRPAGFNRWRAVSDHQGSLTIEELVDLLLCSPEIRRVVANGVRPDR